MILDMDILYLLLRLYDPGDAILNIDKSWSSGLLEKIINVWALFCTLPARLVHCFCILEFYVVLF